MHGYLGGGWGGEVSVGRCGVHSQGTARRHQVVGDKGSVSTAQAGASLKRWSPSEARNPASHRPLLYLPSSPTQQPPTARLPLTRLTLRTNRDDLAYVNGRVYAFGGAPTCGQTPSDDCAKVALRTVFAYFDVQYPRLYAAYKPANVSAPRAVTSRRMMRR